MPARDPLVVVHDLVADAGGVAVTGVDDRVAGSVPSRSEMDSRMVGKSEKDRPVAPGPPLNRVSPLNTAPRSGAYQHTDPGEWPGVCSARISTSPAVSTMPSSTLRKSLSGWVIRHSTSSAGCSSTGASSVLPSSGATVTWSLCPWVQTTATTLRPADRLDDRLRRCARRRTPRRRSRRRRSRCCCRRPNCRRRVRRCRW